MPDTLRPGHYFDRIRAQLSDQGVTSNYKLEATDRTAQLHIYGLIGGWFGDVLAEELVPALRALDVDKIVVYVNSPGGDAFDGIAIRNALAQHSAEVEIHVDGLAASAASVIATAGDVVVMGLGSEIMIHDASAIVYGDAKALRAEGDVLDRLSNDVATLYAAKAGGETQSWRDLMLAETWYSAEEAVASGLADRVDAPAQKEPDAPTNVWDLTSTFMHAGRTSAPAPGVLRPAALAPITPKENTMAPTLETEPVTRDDFEELQRTVTTALETRETQPSGDRRSAAAFLRDLAAGEETARASYTRVMEHLYDERAHLAYTGGTSADSVIQDGWVGDLTRIFDGTSGVLSDFFSTGTLPDKGMNVEYAQLLTNTVVVNEQAAEGDDLAFGKVVLENKTAPVKTYGGYTQLTRQQIERSTLPVLQRSLEALAVAAGARKKAALRAAYVALVAARAAIGANAGVIVLGATLANSTIAQWTDAVIDAAVRFDGIDLPLEALISSPTVFKRLKNLKWIELVTIDPATQTAVGGDSAFAFSPAAPQVGRLTLPGLTGDLAGLPVLCDPGYAGDHAEFANHDALRQYDSALVQLQDENIINLSKDFSVYRYGATATEIPAAVVPLKLTA